MIVVPFFHGVVLVRDDKNINKGGRGEERGRKCENAWFVDTWKVGSLSCLSCEEFIVNKKKSVKMVFFGRKEKIEDRRLLASIDAVNGAKLYHIENGKATDNNNLIERDKDITNLF